MTGKKPRSCTNLDNVMGRGSDEEFKDRIGPTIHPLAVEPLCNPDCFKPREDVKR